MNTALLHNRPGHSRIAGVTDSKPSAGIRLELDGPVARLTLDRPALHNALEAADLIRLRSILEEVEKDRDVRVLVLTGSGTDTFCSGASLRQMESGEMSGELFDTLTGSLARLRVPTVCALNGSVYGGGAELALCCDFRVGVLGTRLSVPAARLGVCYPIGGLTRYLQRLGPATTSRILLAAEELNAEEMFRVGFLTHCCCRSDFDSTVEALIARLVALSPLATQSMKRILLDISSGSVDRAMADALVTRCAESDDMQEGLRAWHERRTPHFTGS